MRSVLRLAVLLATVVVAVPACTVLVTSSPDDPDASSFDAGVDAAPCTLGPCPPSADSPCGLDDGCNYGECDVISYDPLPVETCRERLSPQGDPVYVAHFCRNGHYEGGFVCPSPLNPPDAGTRD
jgi:hypothetical protein